MWEIQLTAHVSFERMHVKCALCQHNNEDWSDYISWDSFVYELRFTLGMIIYIYADSRPVTVIFYCSVYVLYPVVQLYIILC